MQQEYDAYLGKLTNEPRLPAQSHVQPLDPTLPKKREFTTVGEALSDGDFEREVDSLFGDTKGYEVVKRERPIHRLVLWMTLQGAKTKEIALAVRLTPSHILRVQAQPWFRNAFGKAAQEQGKDAVQTFLEGAVVPALQRVEELSRTAESEAVALAANREILDRYLGKSTVKVETKNETRVENIVYDVEKLKAEKAKLQAALNNRVGGGTN